MIHPVIPLMFFFTLQFGFSQGIETAIISGIHEESQEDLMFLKNELKDKSYVLLGEQTHMYSDIFAMKIRVIKFLHEEMGYNTIAMESSMYDIWKMNQTGFDPSQFKNAIWGIWARNEEFQVLIDYIKENGIQVFGLDPQVLDTANFIDEFFEFCELHDIDLKLDEDDMGIAMDGILENLKYDASDISFSTFAKELSSLIKQIKMLPDNDLNHYWLQFSKGLLTSAKDAHKNSEPILTEDFITKEHNLRDRQMADNFLSHIKRFGMEKVIVWADNIHIMNNNSGIKRPIAKEFISAGNYIKEKLKEKVYSLGTIHANDSLYYMGQWEPTPIEEDSFEAILSEKNAPYLFVSSNQELMKRPFKTRLLHFSKFYEVNLSELHDGYIFLKHAGSKAKQNESIPSDTIAAKRKKLESDNVSIDGSEISLKGKLIDSISGEPLAFTNIILKDLEIYRISDEDGSFELTVKKNIYENAVASISSMGYEDTEIPLRELNGINYINRNTENLAEVIIYGNLTPLSVLKKAVKNKKKNFSENPFNFKRYSDIKINTNDKTDISLELITDNYDFGYFKDYISTKRVEQIHWKTNNVPGTYKYTSQLFKFRENAIRYSNILHKRKYKKFELEFIYSTNPEHSNMYIIGFKTERNNWNYTNRGYPTEYSGLVYINKNDFAIIKIIENWETILDKEEIEKHLGGYAGYDNVKQTILKEENVCYFSKLEDLKYYASHFYYKSYSENYLKNGNIDYKTFVADSYLFDYELNNPEVIKYEYYGQESNTALDRIDYSPEFWDNFVPEAL
ncbi:MAG: erythromycin esterase family protein [Zunongwangia sp.]|uniref:erythromycin esterase family protein n=1 Tax=Zunongwangia sp. TaxID=1965325 RepID=UPI003242E682